LERIDPWGEVRDDWRAALIANTVARCHGNKTKPANFLLRFSDPKPERQNPAEMLALFRRLAQPQTT
jgi:hypothetical protein